jgi:lipopolysaccharide transport system ATP-binding protein
MAEYAIQAHGLSKAYKISATRGAADYRTLRESIVEVAYRRRRAESDDRFWALTDVSFDVKHGEAVGFIGKNGAGKSTLLKILSRITRPTRGTADVYGRMGSLLEVGTGFHPELSGRENVYLNGAILGMSRSEIRSRFDEIVAFAEIERFLETPVKRYSSGMYMRLAFAVAAHLQPEILVVDEVLAVGDAAFQAKCLGKMEDVANEGRTVLFVSHNMSAIAQLCSRVILLESGAVKAEGTPDQAMSSYFANASNDGHVELRDVDRMVGTRDATFEWAELQDSSGKVCQDFSIGEDLTVAFGLKLSAELPATKLAVSIHTSEGIPLAHAVDDDSGFTLSNDSGQRTVRVTFNDIRLYPGSYRVSLVVVNAANTEVFDQAEDCLTFRIVDGGKLTMRWLPRHSGLLFLTPQWTSVDESPAAPGRNAEQSGPSIAAEPREER